MKLKKTITCLTLLGLMNFHPINTSLNTANISQIKRGNDEATTTIPSYSFNDDKDGNVTLEDGTKFNVYTQLKEAEKEYTQLKEISDNATCLKLDKLIQATKQLSTNYTACINSTFNPPILNPNAPATQSPAIILNLYYRNVIDALGFFIFNGFKLSAELLTEALNPSDNNEGSTYIPLNGDIAYSSKSLRENIVKSSDNNGVINLLPNSFDEFLQFNNKEKDLAFSLGHIQFIKDNDINSKFSLVDDYDFHFIKICDSWSFSRKILYLCNNIIWEAQERQIIKPYHLQMDLDFTHGIFPKSISLSNGKYLILTESFDDNPLDFILYNKKLCNYNDAKNWENLSDISHLQRLNDSTFYVEKNGTGNSIALSYIQNDMRYITVISNLNAKNPDIHLFTTFYNTFDFSKYSIRLIGKDSKTLEANFKNTSSESLKVQYLTDTSADLNQNLFDNQKNIEEITLPPFSSYEMYINNSSKYMLIKVFGDTWGKYLKIYNYSFDGETTADFKEETIDISEKYLSLQKLKKSSQWEFTVYNPFDYAIDCYYNSKLCFEGDAQNWSNLSNVFSITIEGKKTAIIKISGNFFATTAAFSYVKKDVRYITYANNLKDNGTMTIKTNKKAK